MRELVFLGPRKLEWREAPEPRIEHPEDAIVRPIAATTCDLDTAIIRGTTPFEGPFAIGHECVAEVAHVGPGATQFYRGQHVIVSWHISCGRCHRCARRQLPNTCSHFPRGAAFGSPVQGPWGGLFSDLVRVPHAPASLVPLPPGVDPTHWASLSDNIPFGYELTVPHLLRNPGADVLIMGGCGSVALYAAAFARAAGAGAVDYIDTDRTWLDIATKLGANAIEMPPPRRHGSYPITVDASMNADSLRCAIRSTEPEGQCSSVGCHFGEVAIPMMEMYVRGINFYTGRGQGRPNIEKAMAFVDARRVKTELVTTEVMPFDAAPEVLARGSMKPVLVRPPVCGPEACDITQHSGRIG
ncbi:alcohol dehydrogenase catalytic domain-containing protein [Bradyrhizobium sediminis]|uniref:Alcohol dehydrogenase catalytic domain-containing protein n=1 Tax=Bradyrhizobium sediminis TaxID=2840469 RepID=A0A975NJJ0_9BRAD|nr:alcohol dehydrogenase catalytic domain-containing protein [Bradyrhizobium sediminis]QWG15259.1 alcohol dehydrogenase catalytic domain-containing protein [Bradyrhizobium sediminis]